MNLYFRLIWLLIRLPFMKKLDNPLATTTLTMHAWLNDLDLNFHVNNGRYLTMMDLGRIHLMSKANLLWPMLKNRWMPVLGSAKIHFIRPINAFNKFKMVTQVIYWDDKWIYMEQHIYKKDQLCVTAMFKALFISKKGKIPANDLMAYLPVGIEKPQMPEHLKAWLEAEKARGEG